MPEGNADVARPGSSQRYPNILAIDVGEILQQVQGIIDRVARAVEFVFLFTLAGGLLVLQAAIASHAGRAQVRCGHPAHARRVAAAAAERRRSPSSCCSGALAGLLRRGGRDGDRLCAGRSRLQHSASTANALVWLYGIVGGAIAVTLAGWLGTRSTVNEPPLTVLRQLG